ncbi:MAG: FtsQ-type POTRA domain-containing protein [Coriobacteriia bacterium]|nr:FtsQ-type POTRA domain-containing protein [Coriobacteriia bacterium]
MASSSGRRSGSSGSSSNRKRVVVGAEETVRVRYKQGNPEVESERKRTPRQEQRSASERAGSRVPKPSSAGRKVAGQKRDDRDRRRKEIGRRRVLLVAAAVLAVVAVAWALSALWRAPLFTVDTIKVTGVSHLTSADVLALAAVPKDATLLHLAPSEIEQRVEASPWVSSAKVSRSFPHTLVVDVVERVPIALADAGARGQWFVSGDGHWVARRSKEPTGALVPIKDVPGLVPVAGAKNASGELNNALAVIGGLSPQLKAQLAFVSAPSVQATVLVLKNQIQVFVGSADEITKKDLIARTILGKEKNVVYVNVRVTDRPTWRGLNSGN